VVLRAMGPSMAEAGVSGTLSDPKLELHDSTGALVQANDNWRDNAQSAQEIRANGLAPGNDLESAMIATLEPGAYTAIVRGRDDGAGIALIEVYDLDRGGTSQLGNISTRGTIQSADDLMIGGFMLGGNTRVAVRAVGPSLRSAGITGALDNPQMELRDRDGDLVARNDDWMEEQQADLEAAGVGLSRDTESAILIDLPAGPYTAIVSGANGAAGVALVEVYSIR